MSSGSNSYQQSSPSGSKAYNNALYPTSQPQTASVTQSSLLLNSVNLSWSQPSGCILVAPKPEPEAPARLSVEENSAGQLQQPDSPTSSVSTINNSEYGKISSVSSDFEKLSMAESKDSNLESISHRAVAGSTDSLGVLSSDGSVGSGTGHPISQYNVQPESGPTTFSSPQQPQQPQQSQPAFYKEVDYHWFYQKDPDKKDIWQPFSMYDSYNLEYSFRCGWFDNPIPTNGSRFDVFLRDRCRKPVYWEGKNQSVRRCSWFYKRDSDYKFVPYEEAEADILEATYRECFMNNAWNRRVDLASNEFVIFYAADSVYHYISETSNQDGWGAMMETHMQPRYAYRGVWLTGSQTGRDECAQVDHVVFMVHGIGNFCDISFRELVEVVDDYRDITADLLSSHYGHEQGVGRVEVLPISWHSALHTEKLDLHLNQITLPSIPRLRSFTNDTILDALYYTSPLHSQTILNAVASELNRLYSLFLSRNPTFAGSIGLGGHSLGSLILFDLLSHQATHQEDPNVTLYLHEQLYFRPSCFFAFGSPIPVFLSVRGIYSLDKNFQLPTCAAFYNIFHPYDPIAYRIEPLINVESAKVKPVLIPHHKGRKRFHLEIRDSITRMGSELKEKVLTSIKGTIDSIYGFVKSHQRTSSDADQQLDPSSSNNDIAESQNEISLEPRARSQLSGSLSSFADVLSPTNNNNDLPETEQALVNQIDFGKINAGRRIDYVLQERPIEIVNEYLFAITSHVCYWLSEDTALLVLRELYGPRGFVPKFEEPAAPPPLSASSPQPSQITSTCADIPSSTVPISSSLSQVIGGDEPTR